MKAKIAAWLISLAITVNGGPVEPMETEQAYTASDVVTVTVVQENNSSEIPVVIEETDPDENEGPIFMVIEQKFDNVKTWAKDLKGKVKSLTKEKRIVTSNWTTVDEKLTFHD